MARDNISPLHRVTPPRDYVERFGGPPRHETIRPRLIDRVAHALSAPRFFLFYLGFYVGAMFTVGAAFLWGLYL